MLCLNFGGYFSSGALTVAVQNLGEFCNAHLKNLGAPHLVLSLTQPHLG